MHLQPVRCGVRAVVAHVRMVPRRRLVEDRHPEEVPRHEMSVTGRGPHSQWRDPKPPVEIAERPELDGTRAVPRGPGYRRIHGETTKLVSEASVRCEPSITGQREGTVRESGRLRFSGLMASTIDAATGVSFMTCRQNTPG